MVTVNIRSSLSKQVSYIGLGHGSLYIVTNVAQHRSARSTDTPRSIIYHITHTIHQTWTNYYWNLVMQHDISPRFYERQARGVYIMLLVYYMNTHTTYSYRQIDWNSEQWRPSLRWHSGNVLEYLNQQQQQQQTNNNNVPTLYSHTINEVG